MLYLSFNFPLNYLLDGFIFIVLHELFRFLIIFTILSICGSTEFLISTNMHQLHGSCSLHSLLQVQILLTLK